MTQVEPAAPALAGNGRWITFWRLPRYPPRRTEIFEVRTADRRQLLGEVRWFARWRRYALFPTPGTVFEGTCLRDIAVFCEYQTILRVEERRRGRG